jgi:hypothetical protein
MVEMWIVFWRVDRFGDAGFGFRRDRCMCIALLRKAAF